MLKNASNTLSKTPFNTLIVWSKFKWGSLKIWDPHKFHPVYPSYLAIHADQLLIHYYDTLCRYCVAGTVGHRLMSGKATKVDVDPDTQIDVRCQVHFISYPFIYSGGTSPVQAIHYFYDLQHRCSTLVKKKVKSIYK